MFRGLILRASKNSSSHVGNSTFQSVVNNIKDAGKTVSSKASDLKDKVEDTYERMTEKRDHMGRDSENLSEKIGNATHNVKHKMEDAAYSVKHKAEDVAQNVRHKAEDLAHNVKHKAEDVASKVQHSNIGGALGLDKDANSIHLDDDYRKPVRKVSHKEQEEAYTNVTNPFADKKQTHKEMSHQKRPMSTTSSTRGTHTSSDGVTKPVSPDSTIPWEHATRDNVNRPTCTRNSMPAGNMSDQHFRGPVPESQNHSDVVGSTGKNPIDKEFMDRHGGTSAYTPTMSKSEKSDATSYQNRKNWDNEDKKNWDHQDKKNWNKEDKNTWDKEGKKSYSNKESDHNLNYSKQHDSSKSEHWDRVDSNMTYSSASNKDSNSSKGYNKDMDTNRHEKFSDRNTAAEKYNNKDKNKSEMNYNKTDSADSHSGNKPSSRAFATTSRSTDSTKKQSNSRAVDTEDHSVDKRKTSNQNTDKKTYNTSRNSKSDKEYRKDVYSHETEESIPQSASRNAADDFVSSPYRTRTAQPINPADKTTSKSKNPTKAQKSGLFGADVRRAFSTLFQASSLDRAYSDFHTNDLNSNLAEQEEVNYYSRPHEFTNFEKHGGMDSPVFQSILDQHPGQDPRTILKKKNMEHPLTTHLSALYQPRRMFATRFFGQNMSPPNDTPASKFTDSKSANSEFYYGKPGDGGKVRRFTDSEGKINQSEAAYNNPSKVRGDRQTEADKHHTEYELEKQNQDMNRFMNQKESKTHEYSSESRPSYHDDGNKFSSYSEDKNKRASSASYKDVDSRRGDNENRAYSSGRATIDNPDDFGSSRMRTDSSSYKDASGKRHVDHELQEDLDGMHDKFDNKGKKKFSYDDMEKEKNMRNAAGHVEPGNIFKRFYSSTLKDRIYKENDPDAKNFPFLQHADDEEQTVVPRSTEHVYHVTPPNLAHNRKVETAEHNEKIIPSRVDRRREFSTKNERRMLNNDEDGISGSKNIRKDLENHPDKLYDFAQECSFEGSGGSFEPEPKRHANAYDSKIDIHDKKKSNDRSGDKPPTV